MQIEVSCRPAYSMATVVFDHGESLLVERDAMVTMSDGFDIGGSLGGGGVARAGLRKALGGENFVLGRYTATHHGAHLSLAPKMPGDIASMHLTNEVLLVEQGAFLACRDTVQVSTKYSGLRSALVREGVTMLRIHGAGELLVGSYGGIMETHLAESESMIVDSGHLVGFSDTVDVQVGLLGGATASALTGEGIVAHLTGPGRVMIQTRAEQQLRSWLMPGRGQNT